MGYLIWIQLLKYIKIIFVAVVAYVKEVEINYRQVWFL